MRSEAKSVDVYLESLPPERREVVAAIRKVLRARVPAGYRESMNWGMICYEVPLEMYPETYNGQPLMFAALAAQKNHYGLYLTCVYQDEGVLAELREAFAKSGKKLDMGKSCVRFKRLDDIPLERIGALLAKVDPGEFIAHYEAAQSNTARGKKKAAAGTRAAAEKTASGKAKTKAKAKTRSKSGTRRL